MCSLSLLAAVSCGNGDKQSACEADCDKEAVECAEKAEGNAVIENIMSRRRYASIRTNLLPVR